MAALATGKRYTPVGVQGPFTPGGSSGLAVVTHRAGGNSYQRGTMGNPIQQQRCIGCHHRHGKVGPGKPPRRGSSRGLNKYGGVVAHATPPWYTSSTRQAQGKHKGR